MIVDSNSPLIAQKFTMVACKHIETCLGSWSRIVNETITSPRDHNP
jgi:hypothetical protein